MSNEIKNLQPQNLWANFFELTQIPRPSKKEMKAAQFVKQFGEKLGLATKVDQTGNVIISKQASPGFENRKTVVLQAHIDMVPQANSHIQFNFETDPIDAFIDGDWVTARDTTLGADNGIGVAAAMAVLQSDTIKHGPLEVLITIDEETGMAGAFGLKPGVLKGDMLINMDSENEHEISIGCAGGVDVNASWKFEDDYEVTGDVAFKISVTGLKGGHSGLDIHLGRGNACKLMGRFLKKAISDYHARLATIDCGNMRNAIPREGFSIITLPQDKVDSFMKFVENTQQIWVNELGKTEPGLSLTAVKVELPDSLIPEMIQDDLVNAICAVKNGVIRMSDAMPGVVETSTNLSIVRSAKGTIEIKCLTRSFIDTARDDIASSLESCFNLAGAHVDINGAYPGWKPDTSSELLAIARKSVKDVQGSMPGEVAMHAGLECGILGATYPNWDMISIGPTIESPHSPDERVNIKSVENFFTILTSILENIPVK